MAKGSLQHGSRTWNQFDTVLFESYSLPHSWSAGGLGWADKKGRELIESSLTLPLRSQMGETICLANLNVSKP